MTNSTQNIADLPAYLSHELRNALACIQQFGNILADGLAGEMSSEQREYVGIILENARSIRSVLDSALDGAPGTPEKSTNKIERASKSEI